MMIVYGRQMSERRSLWKADVRETKEEVTARGVNFLNWLFTRKEKEIAIVTHGGFLHHTLAALDNDRHPPMKKEISSHFANCELRSMVIVDRKLISSASSATNFPGKIPCGSDTPSSNVADKKEQQEDSHK